MKAPDARGLTFISGAFFGDALEFPQLELQMHKFWKPKWIGREVELNGKAWFDYRHAHPVLRSHYFLHEYTLAYRRAYKRFYDSKANTTGMYPTKKRALYSMRPGFVSAAINLMHMVDETGLPYDTFFDAAFENMMQVREFKTVWTKARGLQGLKLPPLTVMKDGQIVIAAQQLFERRNLRQIRTAKHPSYRASSWAGTTSQRQYQAYLIREARSQGGNILRALADLAYDRQALHEREILRHMGPDVVRRVRSLRA